MENSSITIMEYGMTFARSKYHARINYNYIVIKSEARTMPSINCS